MISDGRSAKLTVSLRFLRFFVAPTPSVEGYNSLLELFQLLGDSFVELMQLFQAAGKRGEHALNRW
jgi:hypothetical protein